MDFYDNDFYDEYHDEYQEEETFSSIVNKWLRSHPTMPLDLSNIDLIELPDIPPNVRCLILSHNDIKSINNLPEGLEEFVCENSPLEEITLPSSLKKLTLVHNSVNTIDVSHTRCSSIVISRNELEYISEIPKECSYLDLSYNKLSNVPSLGDKLTYLDISNNNIQELPQLPNSILNLNVSDNKIDTLINLPDNMSSFNCNNNLLQTLPDLSQQLIDLKMNHNRFEMLPELPQRLKILDCSFNKLYSIPNIPPKLMYLNCVHNYLSFSPIVNSFTLLYYKPQNAIPVPSAQSVKRPEVKRDEEETVKSEINEEEEVKEQSRAERRVPEDKKKKWNRGTGVAVDIENDFNNIFSKQLDYIKNLPDNIIDSIYNYTSTKLTYTLNNGLVKDEKFDAETTRDYDNIKKAFLNVPPLEQNIRVFRGVRHSEYITAKSFSSCSLDINVSIGFAERRDDNDKLFPECAMVVINVARGCRVLPLWEMSRYPEEMEILLEDGGKFVITEVKKTNAKCKKTIFTNYVPSRSIEVTNGISLDSLFDEFANRKMIEDVSDNLISEPEVIYDIYAEIDNLKYPDPLRIKQFIHKYIMDNGYNNGYIIKNMNNIYDNYVKNILLPKRQ